MDIIKVAKIYYYDTYHQTNTFSPDYFKYIYDCKEGKFKIISWDGWSMCNSVGNFGKQYGNFINRILKDAEKLGDGFLRIEIMYYGDDSIHIMFRDSFKDMVTSFGVMQELVD